MSIINMDVNMGQTDTGGFSSKRTSNSITDDFVHKQVELGNSKKDENNNVGNNDNISGNNITGSKNSPSKKTTSAVTTASTANNSNNTGLIVGLSIGGVLVILIIVFLLNKRYKFIKFGNKNEQS